MEPKITLRKTDIIRKVGNIRNQLADVINILKEEDSIPTIKGRTALRQIDKKLVYIYNNA